MGVFKFRYISYQPSGNLTPYWRYSQIEVHLLFFQSLMSPRVVLLTLTVKNI